MGVRERHSTVCKNNIKIEQNNSKKKNHHNASKSTVGLWFWGSLQKNSLPMFEFCICGTAFPLERVKRDVCNQ